MSDQTTPAATPQNAAAALATIEELQAHVTRLQDELVAQQRLAMLGTMSAMVAHEFNNLMTPVVARAQDALARGDVPAMRKALDRTLIQAEKAIAITQHLLGLGRPEDPQIQVCSVAAAVREAIDAITRPFDKDRIDLRLEVAPDLRVRARAMWLEQLLLNLLLNARDVLKERGGCLTVRARRDGDHVVIDVRDNGTGLSRQRLEEVINPFLVADPGARPGDWRSVGMGLNVCRTIAHRHGATIRAFANADAGCTFQTRWPAA